MTYGKKNQKEFEEIYKKLKPPENCPGIAWRKGNSDGDFDPEIIPLVISVNSLDYCHTTGSCAGHTLKEIKEEFKGWMIEREYRITLTIHVRWEYIQIFSEMVREMSVATDHMFYCELGYTLDYNNRVEEGYTSFNLWVLGETKSRRDKYLKKLKKIVDKYLENQKLTKNRGLKK